MADSLVQRYGAMHLLLGCTEISLGLPQVQGLAAHQLLDPAQVLAEALVQRAYAV